MDVRYNINKIHLNLSDKYRDVKILEKSSIKFGKYFEVVINESKVVRLIIPYKNIDGVKNFEFKYFSNPLLENSDLVTRYTNVENITDVVSDILNNNRFSQDYLKI